MLKILEKLRHGVADWRQRQRAYAELAALDDRSLADIGISRSEIPYVLTHGVSRRGDVYAAANSNLPRAA